MPCVPQKKLRSSLGDTQLSIKSPICLFVKLPQVNSFDLHKNSENPIGLLFPTAHNTLETDYNGVPKFSWGKDKKLAIVGSGTNHLVQCTPCIECSHCCHPCCHQHTMIEGQSAHLHLRRNLWCPHDCFWGRTWRCRYCHYPQFWPRLCCFLCCCPPPLCLSVPPLSS